MKKEMQKILLLGLYSMLLIGFVAGVVSADTPNNAVAALSGSIGVFLGHWAEGDGVTGFEAKVILALLIFTLLIVVASFTNIKARYAVPLGLILTFMFTAYITPDSVLGIFQSYEPVALTIATVIPLLLFFALTYVAADKGVRSLMAIQWVAWIVYFFYLISKPVLALVFFLFGTNGASGFAFFAGWSVAEVPVWGTVQASYYWFSTAIAAFIAFFMVFWNGYAMNWAISMSAGTKDEATITRLKSIARGARFLEGAGDIAAAGGARTP